MDAQAIGDASPEATDRKSGWLREAAGDRYADIEVNCLSLTTTVTASTSESAELVEGMSGLFGLTADETRGVPHALVGTVDELVEALEARRDRWDMSYIVIQEPAIEAFAPVVDRLAGT